MSRAAKNPHWRIRESGLLLRATMAFSRVLMRVYHEVEVVNACPLPRTGAAILASNHVNSVDPGFFQSLCERPIAWMMAKEYMNMRGAGWIFRLLGVIPVERSGRDLTSTRLAMRTLHDGHILGIFPEGKFGEGQILPFQSGVILLAAKAKVPIIPAYIEGTYDGKGMVDAYTKPNIARIAFAPPMHVSEEDASRENIQATANRLRDTILGLQDKFGHKYGSSARIAEKSG